MTIIFDPYPDEPPYLKRRRWRRRWGVVTAIALGIVTGTVCAGSAADLGLSVVWWLMKWWNG